jgi:diguanylate cyclase (GGDEF)-like protein
MMRTKLVPVLVLVLSIVAVGAITLLHARASAGQDAQLSLANLKTALTELQSAPFRSSARTGGSPALARKLMNADKRRVAQALSDLRRRSPVPALAGLAAPLRTNYFTLDEIYAIGASGADFGPRADHLSGVAAQSMAATATIVAQASDEYDRRASASYTRATVGSAAAILLLALAFVFFFRRAAQARAVAERLARANEQMAAASHHEARTDALTGLPNRRALIDALEAGPATFTGPRKGVLALFDLDGFKQYNDTFGHPAGDALLARLGERLSAALTDVGIAYRMGGDEFCVLAWVEPDDAAALVARAAHALSETGDAFTIDCSHGSAIVPRDAATLTAALRLADQRMYEDKAGGSSAGRQSSDVLLKVLSERSTELREHLTGVALLAQQTAKQLGLPAHEIKRIALAAELHDVGKTAIPDAILNKPGPLNDEEWEFMRRHTLIGERIILAAPSLAGTAALVRSSHERVDGTGYPDAMHSDAIPLGARIIAVCDSYDAMISQRPYRSAMMTSDALEELRRCTTTQFDAGVVDAFCALMSERDTARDAA